MADNYAAKDANGANLTFRAIDTAGVLTPVHVLESIPLATGAATSANQSTANTTLSAISGKLPATLGQKAAAASMAVVLASDQSSIPVTGSVTVSGTVAATQSGTWAVTDGGGSITVDGTLAATQSGAWTVSLTGTNLALVAGAATIGSIASVTSSITPGTGSGNLGKAEDAVHASGDVGVMALGVRQDTDATLVSGTGDYTPFTVDALGRLKVQLASGTAGPMKLEDTAHASGDAGLMIMAVRNDAGTSLVDTSGDYAPLQVDSTGALRVTSTGGGGGGDATAANQTTMIGHLSTIATNTGAALPAGDNNIGNVDIVTMPSIPAGANAIGTVGVTSIPSIPAGTNNIGDVDVLSLPSLPAGTNNIGDVDVLSVIPGTAATNLGKARDGVAGATDTGMANLMVRRDSPTAVTPVAGDYEVPQIDSQGRQWVHPSLGTTGGATPHKTISAASTNATSVKASAGTLQSVIAMNNHATDIAYLKIYNLAAAPTVGTSTPVQVYALAPNGGGVALNYSDGGVAFGTGIAFAITAGMADTDTTAVAANQVCVNLTYV